MPGSKKQGKAFWVARDNAIPQINHKGSYYIHDLETGLYCKNGWIRASANILHESSIERIMGIKLKPGEQRRYMLVEVPEPKPPSHGRGG